MTDSSCTWWWWWSVSNTLFKSFFKFQTNCLNFCFEWATPSQRRPAWPRDKAACTAIGKKGEHLNVNFWSKHLTDLKDDFWSKHMTDLQKAKPWCLFAMLWGRGWARRWWGRGRRFQQFWHSLAGNHISPTSYVVMCNLIHPMHCLACFKWIHQMSHSLLIYPRHVFLQIKWEKRQKFLFACMYLCTFSRNTKKVESFDRKRKTERLRDWLLADLSCLWIGLHHTWKPISFI